MSTVPKLAPPPPSLSESGEQFTKGTWQRWFGQALPQFLQSLTTYLSALIASSAKAATPGNGAVVYTATANVAVTNYTNGLYPRIVSIVVQFSAISQTASLSVGGLAVSMASSKGTASDITTLTTWVPPGAVYRLMVTAGVTLVSWNEL